jgi:hypothetical protein
VLGWSGGRDHEGSRPSSLVQSVADDATPTISGAASLPSNFGGAFGGWGKPAVTSHAKFGVPGADDVAASSGALSSIYSQYSEYWSGSSLPTSGAMSTVLPTTNVLAAAPTGAVSNLPPLPTAVTASGFNYSTSVLSVAPTGLTGSATPVLFQGEAAGQKLPMFLACISVMMTAIFSY